MIIKEAYCESIYYGDSRIVIGIAYSWNSISDDNWIEFRTQLFNRINQFRVCHSNFRLLFLSKTFQSWQGPLNNRTTCKLKRDLDCWESMSHQTRISLQTMITLTGPVQQIRKHTERLLIIHTSYMKGSPPSRWSGLH